jgi:DNA-binding NarL/FixJ family response regulator
MNKIRIFVADDHVVLREGLTLLINAQPDMEVVGHANNGYSLVQQLQNCKADILILDISMPSGGSQAAMQLRTLCPEIHIIALTRHSEPGYVRQMLQAGVRAYVLKGAGAKELIDAIHAVAAGDTYLDSTLSMRAKDAFVRSQTIGSMVPSADLSDRETEVVRLTAYGYTNKEVAAQLGVSVKTADTYKARAMEKLGLHSRAALVRYALQMGWLEQD